MSVQMKLLSVFESCFPQDVPTGHDILRAL